MSDQCAYRPYIKDEGMCIRAYITGVNRSSRRKDGARYWDITPAEGLGLFVQYKYKREFLDNHQ
jgi:hypothetical protein